MKYFDRILYLDYELIKYYQQHQNTTLPNNLQMLIEVLRLKRISMSSHVKLDTETPMIFATKK